MAARKRSIVWSFFNPEDEKRVICMICMKTVLYFGHTTNMLRHLRTRHPREFSEVDLRKSKSTAAERIQNKDSCAEVAVVLDGPQVEVESSLEVTDPDTDGAIQGLLAAASGHVTEIGTDGEDSGPGLDGEKEEEERSRSTVSIDPYSFSKRWSAVWLHYRKVERSKAQCLICMYKMHHKDGTSNLLRHLEKKHPIQYAQLEDKSQRRSVAKDLHAYRSPSPPLAAPPLQHSNAYEEPPRNSMSANTHTGVQWSESRMLERERELTEALRRVQQEERRSLEQQREFLVQSRDLETERRALHSQRHAQEDEACQLKKEWAELQKEREELKKEREELYKLKEELQQERAELERLRRDLTEERLAKIGGSCGFGSC